MPSLPLPSSAAALAAVSPQAASQARTKRWQLSVRAAFFLQASITLTFLAGSAAPTPLYPLYEAAWGFSPIVVTLVFGIYALAVLSALLVAGRLSDHVGRRPVLLVAAITQAVAMLVLGTADGVAGLLIGRVIQGLSTGAAVAAVGAGLLDLDRARGTIANAIAPVMGTATGALVGGLMVHYLPAPTHLVYAFFGAVFVLQTIGVVLMPETIAPQPGALASLKPQLSVPPAVRKPLLLAVPMLVAVWAVAGFYGALTPTLVHRVFGFDASLYGGLALGLVAASGAASVLLMQRVEARRMMLAGTVGLLVGMGGILLALAQRQAVLFFVATSIVGMGFGTGFQGAIRTVVPFAAPHERAGVLSVAFIVCYLAMGAPVVVAGYFIAHGNGLMNTAFEFGAVVIALAAAALAGTMARPEMRSTGQARA